jgi:hypothetical protein
MANPTSIRLPISTRHAFALAFDLALRRDALQSLVVPLLLHSPWLLAIIVLSSQRHSDARPLVMLLWSAAALGEFVTHLVIDAMLRFRARSVFNTRAGTHPAPVSECYAQGLKRVPWLIVTEAVRNLALFFGSFFFVFPGLYLGYRLAFATEAVVLTDRDTSSAFARSFRYSDHRFERWLEMVVASVGLAIAVMFAAAVLSIAFPAPSVDTWGAILWFLITAIMPIIQYAWTFFYLRLAEIDPETTGVEVGPAYAMEGSAMVLGVREPVTGAAPRLALVEPLTAGPEPEGQDEAG